MSGTKYIYVYHMIWSSQQPCEVFLSLCHRQGSGDRKYIALSHMIDKIFNSKPSSLSLTLCCLLRPTPGQPEIVLTVGISQCAFQCE
jgi:hypothetical protein